MENLANDEQITKAPSNLSNPVEYRAWGAMIQRCSNSNNPSYKYYGGRGIAVCDRWRASFVNFFTDMGAKPSPKHSIDRVDVNGSYCPDNCRWATPHQQLSNRRPPKNKTGFTGVSYYKNFKSRPFVASIRKNKKCIYLGGFTTATEAHKAFLKAKKAG